MSTSATPAPTPDEVYSLALNYLDANLAASCDAYNAARFNPLRALRPMPTVSRRGEVEQR